MSATTENAGGARRYTYVDTVVGASTLRDAMNPAVVVAHVIGESVRKVITAAILNGADPADALCALSVTAEPTHDPGRHPGDRPTLYVVRAEVTL